ncbi:carboxymuconolactone decarboxylase family protein [uncultured Algibacter sp.]|uniref:carboxymuconolactone decarboxylase family protein n=1 Tax=uncultured Algibacter sp. TaxID=298659 RepID=UPI0032174C92
MSTFNIPTRAEVNATNQAIFDSLEKQVGFVPNLFATYAYSENALKNYIDFAGAPSSLKAKEKEVINLAVSQVNQCEYCLAAHTAIGKMSGFNDAQIIELRQGKASFDTRLDALAALAKNITENRGNTDTSILKNYFNAGWTKENLIDTISLVGDKTISNYINNTVKTTVDFPAAPTL